MALFLLSKGEKDQIIRHLDSNVISCPLGKENVKWFVNGKKIIYSETSW